MKENNLQDKAIKPTKANINHWAEIEFYANLNTNNLSGKTIKAKPHE